MGVTHANQAHRDDGVFRPRLGLLDQLLPGPTRAQALSDRARVWAHFEAPGGGRIALQLRRPNGNEPAQVSVDVSDIRSFVDGLRARGVKIIEPVTKQDFGDSALFADPSGNLVSLVDLSTSKMPQD